MQLGIVIGSESDGYRLHCEDSREMEVHIEMRYL